MKICWASEHTGVGNAYGHVLGARLGREALAAQGVDVTPTADIAVHHAPPHAFQPIDGKVNILWAAWEFTELTPPEVEGLKRADVLFCTAKFLVPVFEQASGVPTFYVPQGIRTDLFTEAKRKPLSRKRRKPFRYLWVGAPNDRKGWKHLFAAWKPFASDPTCELYVKTTFASDALKSGWHGNVIIDTEKRSDDEMVKLYHSAHAFVFPSMGEGFGFTLGEAMATGLPCIYTPATALADLADADCAYPVKFTVGPYFTMEYAKDKFQTVPAANADVTDVARQMIRIRRNYREALRKGHLAACRIRERFTWAHSGRALKARLEMVANELATVST